MLTKLIDQKLLFSITLIFLLCNSVFAQECEEAYNRANTLYAEGKLLQVPYELNNCIERGFESSAKQLNARRLVILSYLYSDRVVEAEDAMLQLLKENAEYKPTSSDPAELRNLYEKFRTRPIMSLGLVGGATYNQATVSNTFGVGAKENYSNVEYQPQVSFKAGVSFSFYLSQVIQINISPTYESIVFETVERPLDFSTTTMRENQNWLHFPLTMRFVILPKQKVKPFIGLGGSARMQMNASIEGTQAYDSEEIADIEATTIDISKQRQEMLYDAIVQLGIQFKTRFSHWSIIGSYSYAFQDFNKPNARYDNSELIFSYGYIDNDVKMDVISLTVGIAYDFYKPKKYRKYKTLD
ncbi:outer membrane beta-barrel protein [Flammeovirga agarivorans]|uniref:Outer membrane beta-barrel protein n=1 Tax=Flammeovirga agarivorans TaxID=2726742 RepID=A0A7X8SI51_9BACT|nr:outer membrane beta-barrel protein [Flammeovirga agarivorans]NLR90656.1 outer membrane beta-barrel protein [Flammeovirga agarivorans]